MYRREYFLLLLAGLSIAIILPTVPSALTQQEERRGLTGAHSILSCENCHLKEVWHTTNINLTICKTCHINVWDTVSSGQHGNLLFEGDMDVATGNVEVKYCATCHNPHQPDVLRLTYTNGTAVYIPFVDYKELCLKCHDFR
ncbi:MAG: cytochrome c3 family protein [Nitrososphaerales archaeon]